ncbi:MAG: cadherin repeat domain-containing protein [Epsilonproteobacteria bacterium]|nr:cadherin repeat domain-containing protein [Campylobacterota bacterium]
MQNIYILFIFLLFVGCGGGSSQTGTEETPDEVVTETSVLIGKAQLGVLSKATVKLYELNGVEQKLLATETTSSGDSIESIGNFNVHLEKLEDDKFYLYVVSEGEDFDVDDDGVIDEFPTKNRGTFHLFAKGSSIKAIQNINVTLVSEIMYQKILPFLESSSSEIVEKLKAFAQEIIETDINGDGFVGREDILRYDPVNNKSNLSSQYQDQLDNMVLNILNGRDYSFEYNTSSVVKPTVKDIILSVDENTPVGTVIGKVAVEDSGDSEILNYNIYGSSDFEIDNSGEIKILVFPNYESIKSYQATYTASNHAGESTQASFTVNVRDLYEPTVVDYPKTEDGIQKALDNGDYYYVLTQLLTNQSSYNDMNSDEINMNIAGAYVGISGYTVYDITSAISDSNDSNSSFNGFINNITQENDTLSTLNALEEADRYYSDIVNGVDCNDTSGLTDEQKSSCFNLGLVRLTSLSNSVKLLFGGDEEVVEKWAEGVETNSSEDLNGNGVIDSSDAAACTIVYANNPDESCKSGTTHTYRGKVTFTKSGVDYNTTFIEVDVGSSEHGYETFYKLVTNKANNNSPLLTNGVCDKNFNLTTNSVDGVNYFPCPMLDSSGEPMGLKESLEVGANIQGLFPDGSETKTTTENYIKNITGSSNGTIGLDNLSDYLQGS